MVSEVFRREESELNLGVNQLGAMSCVAPEKISNKVLQPFNVMVYTYSCRL